MMPPSKDEQRIARRLRSTDALLPRPSEQFMGVLVRVTRRMVLETEFEPWNHPVECEPAFSKLEYSTVRQWSPPD